MTVDQPLVTIALTGDVMLGRLMNDVLALEGPAYPWGNVLPLLRSADLRIVNLECVISDCGQPWRVPPKVFHFRALPPALDTLALAGIDIVTLANNHVLDYEEEALMDMFERLEARRLAFTGAGRNLNLAAAPAIVEAVGCRIAVLAFTDNEPHWAADEAKSGTWYLPITTDEPIRSIVSTRVTDAKQRADVVIVSVHWGPNMILRPPAHHQAFAHMDVDAGADLFIGHSAHLFQGTEWYHGTPIVYDAGDFVDDYAVDPELRNDWGLLFLARIVRTSRQSTQARGPTAGSWRVHSLEVVPLLIENYQVNLAQGGERREIVKRLVGLCAELGTVVRASHDRLEILPPARATA